MRGAGRVVRASGAEEIHLGGLCCLRNLREVGKC